MPNPEDHTRPERSAEFVGARRLLDVVHARGGCALCVHRDKASEGWGRALCSINGRTFPRCYRVEDGGLAFSLDRTVKL